MKPKISYHFWSELLKPKYLQKSLKYLADYGFGLNLAIRPAIIEKLSKVVNECMDYGIDLVLWPLLSFKDGYWVNSWNFELQKKWINKLLNRYPAVNTYTLDLEPPINFRGIHGLIKSRKLSQIRPWRRVREDMENLIDSMHEKKKKVISTNYPINPSNRRKAGTPRPRNADFYSYMVYSSIFGLFGNSISKDNIVAYTGRKILDEHSSNIGIIDVGATSKGVLSSFFPLSSLERIISEIAICKYLGLTKINIFALDYIRQDVVRWMEEIIAVKPKVPPFNDPTKQGIIFKIFRKFLLNETFKFAE
jgi:hypothetical protein